MKRLILFILIFTSVSFSQFLEFEPSNGVNSINISLQNYYFRYNDDKNNILKNEEIHFLKLVPGILYENNSLQVSLYYLNGKYHDNNTKLFSLDGNYKIVIPILTSEITNLGLPLLLKTSYIQVSQQNNNYKTNRIENGSFGLGTGIQFYKSFDWISYKMLYNFCIYYSTINFSIDYGYSLQNDLLLMLYFNNLFDDFGFSLGVKYSDQKWKISQKKYNYYCSNYGLIFGIIF